MSLKNLPPLEVGQAYQAQEFRSFEYKGFAPNENKAILRLHLSNATTIDLPTTDEKLKDLLVMLVDAYGPVAIDHLRSRNWI